MFFLFGWLSFILTADPLKLREDFAITYCSYFLRPTRKHVRRSSYTAGVLKRWKNCIKLTQEVQTICNLLAVNPVTSAAGERSLSSARRLKTSLWSRMRDERFSNLAVLPEWSQAENRQCLYSWRRTGVCFPQWKPQEKLQHCGQLQKVAILGRFI